jgi:hypothetical protein
MPIGILRMFLTAFLSFAPCFSHYRNHTGKRGRMQWFGGKESLAAFENPRRVGACADTPPVVEKNPRRTA